MTNYEIEFSFDEKQYGMATLPADSREHAESLVDAYVQETYGEEGLHTVKNIHVESIREVPSTNG